jgi:tRNA-2-methylthio-N6-dimethylallyladenosine synthase
MNRGYSSKDFFRIVDELRGWVPDIAISTDIMVGFPGETEEDFQGTSALAYPGHLPETVKEQRLHEVIVLQNRISLETNQAMIGKVWEVRVENRESKKAANLVTARTRTNHVVHFADPQAEEGSLRRVRITQANPFHLKGEAIH